MKILRFGGSVFGLGRRFCECVRSAIGMML